MTAAVDTLLAVVASAGVSDLAATPKPAWGGGQLAIGVEGIIHIAGERVRIGFGLLDDFPDSLPKVVLLSSLEIPHVDDCGVVCAFEGEGTLHDHREDELVIRETIERARGVIERGLLRQNFADFTDEADAYWRKGETVPSVVEANSKPRKLDTRHAKERLVAVADSATAMATILPSGRGRSRTGLYLPLDAQRLAAAHPRRLTSWPTVLAELSAESRELVSTTTVGKYETIYAVLGVPRSSGGYSLLGLSLRKFDRGGCLADVRPVETSPFQLQRFDKTRVQERLSTTRRDARIAVIGCGAVGGHLAHAMAWTGPDELILVDPDRYGAENTFRHVLGRAGWGQASKASGLAKLLAAQLPGLKVTPLALSAARVFQLHADLLHSCSTLVVAIGNPSVPLRLNDDLAAMRFPVPVIYTWLEPHGIGGHALLVRYGQPGCLRCVFPDGPELHCSIDFSAPGQRVVRRELGCAGIYAPYSDLDARETALSAARLVERSALGMGPAWLRSWRGDATRFRSAGLKLSPRYDEFPQGLDARLEPRTDCRICGV